ncbi:MAG: ArsR family transcriptional regulator [Demequinaceae bacterium]|nr:ArsR family transcriptional regulator [Demequinaceae bacterium]
MSAEEPTRERVLDLIVSEGPVSVAELADDLCLTPAGIRRHLSHLIGLGHIVEREAPGRHERGRGRPARCYVATPEGQKALTSAYASVAVDALGFLRKAGGLEAFVAEEAQRLERALAERIDQSAPLVDRVDALAAALSDRGYAASVRPLPGGFALQLCQGHCPVLTVAEASPEWCEAETRALSRALGVHVQRLSTLAGGAHVCTTNIPLAMAGGRQS